MWWAISSSWADPLDDWKLFYAMELCGILWLLLNGLYNTIHDNSSFLEPAYQSLLGKMDNSCESLSKVMKMILETDLEPKELMLEQSTRTQVYRVIDHMIIEALFQEIYAAKSIFRNLWSVYQCIVTVSSTLAMTKRNFCRLKTGHDMFM